MSVFQSIIDKIWIIKQIIQQVVRMRGSFEEKKVQGREGLSEKDLQLLKKTYHRMTQLFYDNIKSQSAYNDLLNLSVLITEVIASKKQSELVSILSILEILKVKSKAYPQLILQIEKTIQHLKNPKANEMKYSTVIHCLQKSQLFTVGCTMIIRFYQRLVCQGNAINWKEMISELSRNVSVEPSLCIELALQLCLDNELHCKTAVKSGLVKYIFSSYLSKVVHNDKYNLYKAIKLIKIIVQAERTILREREKYLALVLYTYQQYIPIIQEIVSKCYDQQYSQENSANIQKIGLTNIDFVYLWSYYEQFCQKNIHQNVLKLLQKILQIGSNQNNGELEFKTYAILSNYTKYTKIILKEFVQILPKNNQSLLNYIKLCINSIYIDPNSISLINIEAIEQLVDKSSSAKVGELFKVLKNSKNKESKIGQLGQNLKNMYNVQKNADFLLERASRIPQNNEHMQEMKQILMLKDKGTEFELDTLRAVKEKSLNSISTALIQRKPLDLNLIVKSFQLADIMLANKLLQILELYLMMNPDKINIINSDRILEIIQWIENNYNGEMIDWGSISQLLVILKGEKQWINHLDTIPEKCFWLLAIVQDELTEKQEDLIFNKLKSFTQNINKKPAKSTLIIGFLGKVLGRIKKAEIIMENDGYFKFMESSIRNNLNFRSNLLMLSYFFKSWYEKSEEKQVIQQNHKFEETMTPIVKFILNNFRSTEQEYQFLQSCLPFQLKSDFISENLEFLLDKHGKLASYIYKNNSKAQITGQNKKNMLSYEKFANLPNLPVEKSEKILQILQFLEDNSQVLQSSEIQKLIQNIINRKNVYWEVYPNFVNILTKIITILTKTENTNILENLDEILTKIINCLQKNEDLSADEIQDVYEQIKKCLEKHSKKGTFIEIEKIRRYITKIIHEYEEVREEIIVILNGYKVEEKIQKREQKMKSINNNNMKSVNNNNIKIQSSDNIKSKPISQSKPIVVPAQKEEKIERNYLSTVEKIQSAKIPADRKSSLLKIEFNDQRQELEKQQNQSNIEEQVKNLVDNVEVSNIKNGHLTVLQALRILKKMVDKEVSVQQFQIVYEVFLHNSLQPNEKDILGHLLAKFYPLKNDPHALTLLLMKDKTNLSKEACYELLSKFQETFVLAKRWKLFGRQWMDLAMRRVTQGYFAEGCEVAEYNLVKMADVEYFYSKKYQEITIQILKSAITIEDMIHYLELVGTGARLLPQIKQEFIEHKVHVNLLSFLNQHSDHVKIIANASYALSALVCMQPQICLEIVKQKTEMIKLLTGYRSFFSSRPVVQSGACLIANIAYSNDEVKQVLRSYNVVELLTYLFQNNLTTPDISTYKQLLRAFGNLSISEKCAKQIVDQHFFGLAVRMVEQLDIFVHYDEKKAKLMKIFIDLIVNVSVHKYKLDLMHKQKITLVILTLLETTQSNAQILTGCIDTIDGLCQNQQIENYAVKERKLLYILIDILKIQEDQRIIIKSTRLLTNLTINPNCVPQILQANLLSVLANIVMPHFYGNKQGSEQNKKMEGYISKIITRIHSSKQSLNLILKSGYLDCLVRTIETSQNLEDYYIDILGFYSQHLPSFLNKRAFMCLIRVLTRKHNNKDVVEKCLAIFKNLLTTSSDKDEQTLVIEGIPRMYEKLLVEYREDAIFLLGYHCMRSYKLRDLLRKPQCKIYEFLKILMNDEQYSEIMRSIIFTILNVEGKIVVDQQEKDDKYYNLLRKGIQCKLFRGDGSSKKAIIDIDEEYNIRAYKYPDGEIKKKYTINIRFVKDFQFHYVSNSEQWNLSIFSKMKSSLFETSINHNCQNCCTIIGSCKWGEICFLNVEFQNEADKMLFYKGLSSLLYAFRG